MNHFKLALQYLPSIICASTAAYLAIHDITGWGWFLFIALIIVPDETTNTENEEE